LLAQIAYANINLQWWNPPLFGTLSRQDLTDNLGIHRHQEHSEMELKKLQSTTRVIFGIFFIVMAGITAIAPSQFGWDIKPEFQRFYFIAPCAIFTLGLLILLAGVKAISEESSQS
jgi:hypothetical protein